MACPLRDLSEIAADATDANSGLVDVCAGGRPFNRDHVLVVRFLPQQGECIQKAERATSSDDIPREKTIYNSLC